MTAALVLALGAPDVAPLPTVPARPAWCAKRVDAALEARSPGNVHRLTAFHRDGAYAYVNWRAHASGGQAVLVHNDAGWCVLGGGGGAMDAQAMVEYGVPRATAQRLYRAMQHDMKRDAK